MTGSHEYPHAYLTNFPLRLGLRVAFATAPKTSLASLRKLLRHAD